MNSFTQLVQAVRGAQWSDANRVFAEVMQQKVADRLQQERQTIFAEEAEAFVVYKSSRSPETESYSGPAWSAAGITRQATYSSRAAAQAAADKLSKSNPVRFAVGTARKAFKEAADSWGVVVKKQEGSKNWGVYINGKLKEGGFFDKDVADECADDYRSDLRNGKKV